MCEDIGAVEGKGDPGRHHGACSWDGVVPAQSTHGRRSTTPPSLASGQIDGSAATALGKTSLFKEGLRST